MNELIANVVENLRTMIEHGLDGDSIASDERYTVLCTLVDNSKPRHYRDAVWLREAYVEERRSMQNIASEFGITPAAINQWLNKHDIPTRSRGRLE